MAKNFLLDVLSASPTPVDSLILPSLVWNGSITRMTNGEFRITNLGKPGSLTLVDEPSVLLMGAGFALQVKLKSPINKTAIGNEFHFEGGDGDTSKIDQSLAEVYRMREIPVFEFEHWKSKNQIRYTNASIAAKKLRHRFAPINVIVSVLSTVDEWVGYWQGMVASQTGSIPTLSSMGESMTVETCKEQLEHWKFLQDTLKDVADFAVTQNLTAPIDEDKYTIELRSITIVMICAALDLDDSSLFEKMSAEQINQVWADITEMINTTVEIPVVAEDTEPKKNTPSRGRKSKRDSIELATISPASSEPESIQSGSVETSVLAN